MPSSHKSAYRGTDYLLGILVLLAAGLLLIWTARYLQPVRLPPLSPGSYHFIARLDDVAPGSSLSFMLEGRPWLLARRESEIMAVSGLCTFRGSKILWDEDNQVFLCEGHGCTFGYRGHRIQGLAADPLETLRIKIVGERIYGARRRS
ncbi:MAG: Rieske 2Fe-2S domain-containing protein [bacterium]|nr:MAG: Rieske 2Fe-2S domain-containing protein [bacterium]